MGGGAFHRCHQAEYLEDLIEGGHWRGAEVGLNLLPPVLEELLVPQGGLFSRTLAVGDRAATRVLGAITQWADGAGGLAEVVVPFDRRPERGVSPPPFYRSLEPVAFPVANPRGIFVQRRNGKGQGGGGPTLSRSTRSCGRICWTRADRLAPLAPEQAVHAMEGAALKVRELGGQGGPVILYSSEDHELLENADRVLVFTADRWSRNWRATG